MAGDGMGDIAHTGHEPMRWTITRVVKAGGHDWSIVDGPYCQRVEVVEAQQLEGAVGALAEAIDIAERHLPDNRSTYRADRQRLAELRASLNQQRGAVGVPPKMTRAEAVIAARSMYGDGDNGWSMAGIHAYVRARGVDCGYVTVVRWCKPAYYQQELAYRRATLKLARAGLKLRKRKRYVFITRSQPIGPCPPLQETLPPAAAGRPEWTRTIEGRMKRMRALYATGIGHEDVGRVMALDLGEPQLERGVIKRALTLDSPPRAWRPPGRMRRRRLEAVAA